MTNPSCGNAEQTMLVITDTLAEQWKGRADDAGQMSRAWLALRRSPPTTKLVYDKATRSIKDRRIHFRRRDDKAAAEALASKPPAVPESAQSAINDTPATDTVLALCATYQTDAARIEHLTNHALALERHYRQLKASAQSESVQPDTAKVADILTWARKEFVVDTNGDPFGAQPLAGWETGYAAGIRCFYRVLRDRYTPSHSGVEEG